MRRLCPMANWNWLFSKIIKAENASSEVPADAETQTHLYVSQNMKTGNSAETKSFADEWPFAELGHFKVHEASVRLLDYEFCLQNYVVVLDEVDVHSGDTVTVGMLHPGDTHLVKNLSGKLGRAVQPVALTAHEIIDAVDKGYGLYDKIQQAQSQEHNLHAVNNISVDPSLPVTTFVDELLGYAIHRGASDIHIETYEDDVDVRLRIDGVLLQLRTPLSPRNARQAVQRLKVLARLDIIERYRAQDGRIATEYTDEAGNKKEIDFRLSILPGPYGEDAVLRILGSEAALIDMEQLGFDEDILQQFSMLSENPEGLILVTGPTGSGKTTTLYSAINRIHSVEKKIITVEDPVEIQFDKVNQKQVTVHMGFAEFTRSFLRQDPDVILVGEIRDQDTAQVAVRAAHTGHLVLSTLHTIDSTRAVTRMESLGVDPDMLATTLIGVLSQRLARKICSNCRTATPPASLQKTRLCINDDDQSFFTGTGCEKCNNTGMKGRIAIFELFIPDEEIADMLAREHPIHQIRNHVLAAGMRSLYQDAMTKARSGQIPLSEVLRVIPYRMMQEAAAGK